MTYHHHHPLSPTSTAEPISRDHVAAVPEPAGRCRLCVPGCRRARQLASHLRLLQPLFAVPAQQDSIAAGVHSRCALCNPLHRALPHRAEHAAATCGATGAQRDNCTNHFRPHPTETSQPLPLAHHDGTTAEACDPYSNEIVQCSEESRPPPPPRLTLSLSADPCTTLPGRAALCSGRAVLLV